MTQRKLTLFVFTLLFVASSIAQDRDYAKKLIDTLASPGMYGRGYVNKGDSLAASFIAAEFRKVRDEILQAGFLPAFPFKCEHLSGAGWRKTQQLGIDARK
jgi:aminopeptidase YwaD